MSQTRLGAGGITIDDVSVSYRTRKQRVEAVRNVSLTVRAGEFVALVGPSGCGKSTLLHAVAGLIDVTEGTLTIGERTPRSARDEGRIALVQQDPSLLPWRSVADNIKLLLQLTGRSTTDPRISIPDIIKLVGLEGFENAKPAQLSGGMRQRASLARALVLDPSVLLMDEPFAAVDEITRQRLGVELTRIWEATKSTVLFVTHSLSEALFLSDRVVMLTNRPGRIFHEATVDYDRPRLASLRTDEHFTAHLAHLEAKLLDAMNMASAESTQGTQENVAQSDISSAAIGSSAATGDDH